jgi:hypothetical protein
LNVFPKLEELCYPPDAVRALVLTREYSLPEKGALAQLTGISKVEWDAKKLKYISLALRLLLHQLLPVN